MGHTVIVAYRPKPGMTNLLITLVKEHVQILRAEDLATAREPFVMQATDGTVLEVFEWVSEAAVKNAHSNAAVQALWVRFAEVCDYVPLCELAETRNLFAGFESVG